MMNNSEIESFPPHVTAKLKTYVYRLIDRKPGAANPIKYTWAMTLPLGEGE
jgi:hypothetical protein